VHQAFQRALDRRDNARMLVPERCTHLPGLEVEIFLPVGIGDNAAA
jgi:hypothetical protein